MNIAIGSDHAGFTYKTALIGWLKEQGHSLKDFGTYTPDSADYADFAHPVALAVEAKEYDFGVLICGSANGVAITANKHQGIRAAICWNDDLAGLARQHNDANVICLPERFMSLDMAEKALARFLITPFEGGRHANRVAKIAC